MKRVLFSIFSAVLLLFGLWSCEKQIEGPIAPQELHISVRPVVDALAGVPETKTYINSEYTVLWGKDESMKIGLLGDGDASKCTWASSTTSAYDGAESATFTFSVTPEEDKTGETYTYIGLYPASVAVSNNTNLVNYKVKLPSTQTASSSSYDPKAYIMVAKPESGKTATNADWIASYRRATALNKITLTGLSEDIKRVTITAPEGVYLAGGRYIDLTTGESGEMYTGGEGTETVDVRYDTKLSGGSEIDVWFTSWDASIPVGSKLIIVAYSDVHTFTREITVANKPITFKEGYLNTLKVGMINASQGNNTELAEGSYVVLAKDGNNYYALKAEKEDGKDRLLSVAYTGDTDSYTGDSDIIWNLTKTGNSFIFENNNKYLGYRGTSNESFWLEASTSWTETNYLIDVTPQETDGLYYVTLHSNTSRYLSKNSSSAYFAFYGNTGQKADIVFVPATALNIVAIPTFSPAAGEVASGTEVTISCATSGATIYYTVDGTDPTSSSSSFSSPITIINGATTVKAFAVKEGMTDSEIATATYTVGSVTLTEDDITVGENTVKGTENDQLAYRLGTSSNNGQITFKAGYSYIILRLEAYSNTPRTFSITNGKINNESSLSPKAGVPSGTINAGFSRTDTGTEYTIVVTDPTKPVVFSGRRGIVWGFTATSAGPAVTWNIESISVTTAPAKTVYTAGESFDPAGMVVTGHFVDADDNTNTKDEAVTGYTITPGEALAVSDTQVTITYQGKTATQNITVNATPVEKTMTVDFESATTAYSDYWDFNNMTTQQSNDNVSAHGGSYIGTTGGKASATLTTYSKIAHPASITFYISKASTNNTASSWNVRVSSDGSSWTIVGDSQSASAGLTRGTWYEVTRDLSSYSDVYVQIQYDGTTALRTIDDVTLTYK